MENLTEGSMMAAGCLGFDKIRPPCERRCRCAGTGGMLIGEMPHVVDLKFVFSSQTSYKC